jgi:predicted RNA-binding protein YlqC (UPF0109 family)
MKQQQNIEVIISEAFRELVSPLLKYQQDLDVWTHFEDGIVCLECRANFADMGKILGSQRKTFNAIEEIMQLIAGNWGFQLKMLPLNKPIIGEAEDRTETAQIVNWDSTETKELLEDILKKFANEKFKIETLDTKLKTVFTITLSKKEKLPMAVGQLGFSLGVIFHAIGRNIGRDISVKAVTKLEAVLCEEGLK